MVRLATLLGDPSTFGSAAGDKRPLQPTTGRDGIVVVVSKDHTRCLPCEPATSMQNLMEQWPAFQPKLEALYARVNGGEGSPFSEAWAASPLPRAYQWLDGSAYVNHVELVRKARGAEMPASFWTDPLMYQGGSDTFLAPHEPITGQVEWGIDFEGELGVVTGDVPLGVSEDEAASAIRLLVLVNDVSLRKLIPAEVAKGFGFIHGKPPTAFGPVAVTPDELGDAWHAGKVHLPLLSEINGKLVGWTEAGVDMIFSFPQLIAHAAKTRPLGAGTIIGSGTVSNKDQQHGWSCIAEVRMIETINDGAPKTDFLRFGDRVRLEVKDKDGVTVFGAIDQLVKKCE